MGRALAYLLVIWPGQLSHENIDNVYVLVSSSNNKDQQKLLQLIVWGDL